MNISISSVLTFIMCCFSIVNISIRYLLDFDYKKVDNMSVVEINAESDHLIIDNRLLELQLSGVGQLL